MKLRWLLPALCFSLISVTAKAQIGLFFNPIVTHATNSTADTGPYAFLGVNSKAATFGGVSMGALVQLLHAPKYDVGAELRDELQHTGTADLNSILVGVRVARSERNTFKPYVELAGGGGTTKSPYSQIHSTKGMYKVYGGLDFALNRHVDFRAVEIGYGSLTTISSGLYGGAPVPAANLFSVSAGFVFNINKVPGLKPGPSAR